MLKKPLSSFKPDPNQPRKSFNEADLRALGESMKDLQLQPVVANAAGTILCGERRYRAAQLVGMAELAVIHHREAAVVVPSGQELKSRRVRLHNHK